MTRVTVDPHPAEGDVATVVDGLRSFNEAVIGERGFVPLGVFARDDAGRVLGGLVGRIAWRWLYVEKFWLPDALRGKGLGSRLLSEAERWAAEHGCIGCSLDTLDFQALPFYQKQGYELFGTLEGFPPRGRQYYLRKDLVPVVTL